MLRPNMWATKVLVLVALVFLTYPEVSMAQGQSLTLFSEVRGRLVNSEGKPQAGVRVSRYWQKTPEDEPVTSETTTDREGYFFFPAVTEQNSSDSSGDYRIWSHRFGDVVEDGQDELRSQWRTRWSPTNSAMSDRYRAQWEWSFLGYLY